MTRRELIEQITYILECADREAAHPRPVIRSGARRLGERLGFTANQLARFERDFFGHLEVLWRAGVGDVPSALADWIREAVTE